MAKKTLMLAATFSSFIKIGVSIKQAYFQNIKFSNYATAAFYLSRTGSETELENAEEMVFTFRQKPSQVYRKWKQFLAIPICIKQKANWSDLISESEKKTSLCLIKYLVSSVNNKHDF